MGSTGFLCTLGGPAVRDPASKPIDSWRELLHADPLTDRESEQFAGFATAIVVPSDVAEF